MKSIKNITEYHMIIKKSEFITTLIPVNDESLIDDIILKYKEKY